MSFNPDVFEIIIDDKIFILSRETLKRNRQCKLSKFVFDNISDPCILLIEPNKIIIDRDAESFSFIISKMRGYNINYNEIKDNFLKEKVIHDVRYFGLIEKIGVSDVAVPDAATTTNVSENTENIKESEDSEISDSTEEEKEDEQDEEDEEDEEIKNMLFSTVSQILSGGKIKEQRNVENMNAILESFKNAVNNKN